MKITIESTDKTTTLDGVDGRIWRGVTDSGIPCSVFVHRIAVEREQDTEQFDQELKECMPPAHGNDLRWVL